MWKHIYVVEIEITKLSNQIRKSAKIIEDAIKKTSIFISSSKGERGRKKERIRKTSIVCRNLHISLALKELRKFVKDKHLLSPQAKHEEQKARCSQGRTCRYF